jgi:uncharacterized protein YuzE
MNLTLDTEVDAAYISLTGPVSAGAVVKTYCCDPHGVGGQIHLDFDADGRLLGIEILGASSKLPLDLLIGR